MRIVGTTPVVGWNHGVRRARMEELLGAFKVPPYWERSDLEVTGRFRLDRPIASTCTEVALGIIVEHGRTVPPNSSVEGVETWLRLVGSSDTFDALSASNKARAAGPRAAVSRGTGWPTWTLVVPRNLMTDECAESLSEHFAEITELSGNLILRAPTGNFASEASAILTREAARSGVSVVTLWRIARSLHAHHMFLDSLPELKRTELAVAHARELTASARWLDLETDISLGTFRWGGGWRLVKLAGTRAAQILAVERSVSLNWRPSSFFDDYFYDLAEAIAETADYLSLGRVLTALEPGVAIVTVLDYVRSRRPELIASLVWHVQSVVEGSLAALGLRPITPIGTSTRRDCTDEWNEIQEHTRWQLLHGSHAPDLEAATDVAIHDEGAAEWPVRTSGDLSTQVIAKWFESWVSYVGRNGGGEILAELIRRLADPSQLDERLLRFSLRILSLLNKSNDEGAPALASAVIEAYGRTLALEDESFDPPHKLYLFGDLTAHLFDATKGDSVLWNKWLRPFSATAYIERATVAPKPATISSAVVTPAFDAPVAIRTHAGVLSAQAQHLPAEAARQLAGVVLELYALDRRSGLPVPAFSWVGLGALPTSVRLNGTTSVFRDLGQVLARVDESGAMTREWIRASPSTLVLALILGGLVDARAPIEKLAIVQLHLRDKIASCLSGATPIGKLLAVATLALVGDMPLEAERCAKAVIEIVSTLGADAATPFEHAAVAIVAGARASMKRWEDTLAVKPPGHGSEASYVLNMHAVALLETGRVDEALDTVAKVLERETSNAQAFSMMTACYSVKREWQSVLDTADRARVHGALSAVLLKNQGIALGRLNEEIIPGEMAVSSAQVREPAIETESFARALRNVAMSPYGVDIAIITVIQEEYDAVYRLLELVGRPQLSSTRFGWVEGQISGTRGLYRVVLARVGLPGNVDSSICTTETFNAYRPRHIILTGIAGGFPAQKVHLGDVVIAREVYPYEYMKVEEELEPRVDKIHPVCPNLYASAQTHVTAMGDWHLPLPAKPGTLDERPQCRTGTIGSGEKVMDDQRNAYFLAILKKVPKLHAIEMEAFGVARAVAQLQANGNAVNYAVVRGISDTPVSEAGEVARTQAGRRDEWKPYAAAVAAQFVVSWIQKSWHEPPIGAIAAQIFDTTH